VGAAPGARRAHRGGRRALPGQRRADPAWLDADRPGTAADSPLGAALLAIALAKLGDVAEAAELAAPLIVPMREQGQHHEARLAHLAYGIALRARGEYRAARRAALQDPLTGLGNRRRFDQRMALVDRGGVQRPLALLLIDVDKFKDINDRYSHGIGDRVLAQVADLIRAHCRQPDHPFPGAWRPAAFPRSGDASHRQCPVA
jgi:GGDEF domain-containing protein